MSNEFLMCGTVEPVEQVGGAVIRLVHDRAVPALFETIDRTDQYVTALFVNNTTLEKS